MHKCKALLFFLIISLAAVGQDYKQPLHQVGLVLDVIKLDGDLTEQSWQKAPVLTHLKTIVPVEGGTPTGNTEIRIIAEPKYLYFAIISYDPDPSAIVSFSKLRDADLENEDHIRIVLDPSLDGQSGYVFAVNPSAARYDALVSNRGESENANWDGV